MSKTCIVCATFGLDGVHLEAAAKAQRRLSLQAGDFHWYWYDLAFDDSPPLKFLTDTPWTYKSITGKRSNRYLFQKECLYNRALRDLSDRYDQFIFLDSDIFSEDRYWLEKYRKKIVENPHSLIQGFRFCIDTESSGTHSQSMLSYYKDGVSSDLPLNPGLAIGFSKRALKKIRQFPTKLFEGSDDLLLVYEQLSMKGVFPFPELRSKIEPLLRTDIEPLELDYLDMDINHQFHGTLEGRQYHRRYLMLKDAKLNSFQVNESTMLREWKTLKSLGMKRRLKHFHKDTRGRIS